MMLVAMPEDITASRMADWAEAMMLANGRARMSRDKLDNLAREAEIPTVRVSDLVVEAINEIQRRATVLGDRYPFEWHSDLAQIHVSRRCLPYEFLLCLACSVPFRAERRWPETEKSYDDLVANALIAYFGPFAQKTRVAWGDPGRPARWDDFRSHLCATLKIPRGTNPLLNYPKDAGSDVIVWVPFRDGREGFVTLLAQCTVQRDDWVAKAGECNPRRWCGWVDFKTDPLTCLAIPFAIPKNYPQWHDLTRTVNLVLDRLRICELLPAGYACSTEIEEWTAKELDRMVIRDAEEMVA